MAGNDTTMASPQPDQSSRISTYNRIIALEECQVEQYTRAGKLASRIFALKPHRGIPVETLEKCRTFMRENETEQKAMRDELDKKKKEQAERSADHDQDLDCNYLLQLKERVRINAQVMVKMEHLAQTVEMEARAEKPLLVIHSDYKDVASQTDTKSETASTSGN